MNNEFKKSKSNNETRYTLESMTAGATGSGSIATSVGSVGKVQKRGNILAQEAGKDKVDASKPRNFVAKNAKMGGAGAHKDKKKEQKQGAEKHKKPYMEALKQKIEDLKSKLNEAQGVAEGFNSEYDDEAGMAQSNLLTTARAVMGLLKTIKDRDNLPEWGQEKIAKAEMMLVSVWDYLQSQKEMGNDPQQDMEEGAGVPFRGVGGAFNRGDDERHDLDPTDWYFVKDGKMFAISVYPNQEREATARGYSRTRDEAKAKASQQGVAEGASDFVGDSIEALRSSVPGLKQQDFLDELYMYIENQYGQRAAEMMSNAGQDDFDEWYDSYLDNPEQGVAESDTYMESLAESLQEVLSEKAVSKKQQRFMGMVHAAQKGEKPASKEVAKVAKDMGKKDAKDFAATKHKGLPEKKKSKK